MASMTFTGLMPKKKVGLMSKPKVSVVVKAFDDESSDEADGDGRDMVRKAIEAQAAKNELIAEETRKRVEAECPEVFQYDERYEEIEKQKSAIEKAKRQHAASRDSKWIADMKRAASKRETERELTDLRLIQQEAEATNHMYSEVDHDVAPIVTAAYRRKIEEQRLKAEQDAVVAVQEDAHAAEKIGFASFKMNQLKTLTRTQEEEQPEDEYEKELEGYLQKKEQQRKKERRERYHQMKREQQEEADAPPAEAARPDDAQADGAQGQPAADAPPAAREASEGGDGRSDDAAMAGGGDDSEPAAGGGAGAGEDDDAPMEMHATADTIQKLAYVEEERKQLVRERRLQRLRRRNAPEDVDRARDRFLKRRLERMRLLHRS